VATFPTAIGEKCGELILQRIASAGAPADTNGDRPKFSHHLVEPALRVRASTAAWRPRQA
jgi:LacI family transcriptional regulator